MGRPPGGLCGHLCVARRNVARLVIPCPYSSSKDSEFRSFVSAVRYLVSGGVSGSVFFCIDNSQLVDSVDWCLSHTSFPPASTSTKGTWQHTICTLFRSVTFTIGAGWLKSHVGFQGNELADAFAKCASYACKVESGHLQYPAPHTVTFNGDPAITKFGGAHRRRLYPKHGHTGIHVRTSFDWSRHYSWFSSFTDKWVLGIKGVHGSPPFCDLADLMCPHRNDRHPMDLASCVALCSVFSQHRERMVDAWGPTPAPTVHTWINQPRTCGELRNFARTLVPSLLYSTIQEQQELRL